MERLLAADVLLGEQAALLIPASTNYAYLATSVFYFASRVVDKLWNGSVILDLSAYTLLTFAHTHTRTVHTYTHIAKFVYTLIVSWFIKDNFV